MNAFITGSRAYGKPTPNSDIDLVIRANSKVLELLRQFSEDPNAGIKTGGRGIRFGKLNLLCA